MEESEILHFFQISYTNKVKFNKLSIKELVGLMEYIDLKLKTDKGNYSIEKLNIFCSKHKLKSGVNAETLKKFYDEYSRRKKPKLKFKNFLDKINSDFNLNTNNFHYSTKDKKPKVLKVVIKNKKKTKQQVTKEFIKGLKDLKNAYIEGSNEDFIKVICKNFELKYSEGTIRNFFYENEN